VNIAFCFYGIIFGPGGRTGSDRDFRHCWINIKKMLIDPFVAQGHVATIIFSGYRFEDKAIEQEFYDLVNPNMVYYSEFEGSDAFTTKKALIQGLSAESAPRYDQVIFTRSDIHFSKVMANETKIEWDKFNFLFKEKGWWEGHQFTCDNFYVFPSYMSTIVNLAMGETYAWPRGKPYVDTHGLLPKLSKYVRDDRINFISDTHEISDVNSYYTCCRSGLPEDGRGGFIHPEVKDRFGYR